MQLERRRDLANGRQGRFQAACRLGFDLPAQAKSDKSQGVRGTEAPDSINQKLKKTEKHVSVFSGEVHSKRPSKPPNALRTARLLLSALRPESARGRPSGPGVNADIPALSAISPIISMNTLRSNSVPAHTVGARSSRTSVGSSRYLKIFRRRAPAPHA